MEFRRTSAGYICNAAVSPAIRVIPWGQTNNWREEQIKKQSHAVGPQPATWKHTTITLRLRWLLTKSPQSASTVTADFVRNVMGLAEVKAG
jgi:hypothetical protein